MEEKQSMKDFESDLERSFIILHEGDLIDTTVIGISDTEITVDLNYYTEGIIPLEECSDQQNEADSELLRGMLADMGYEIVDTDQGADVIVINTCAIREHAEQRVFGDRISR